ncbi:hypothetical protein UlMin_041977 [Ulmus minor]
MAASSSTSLSSSCSADPSQHKYDIFISFRGETREKFTSHLYTALRRKQIRTYIDEASLQKGDEISGALPKAIEESTISIIIFSENYASSTWCLDELVQILKCREENGQIVLPIFYGVDPSHIRKQEGSYAVAFVKHEERFENDMKKVQEWRAALTEAAKLSGWDSRGRYESILVETVVEDVMGKLCNIWSNCIDDSKGFVGIHRRLEKIESLLCIGSPTVRIVGIWGMGGIGKTTLARVVFNKFSNQFEGKYFVLNVREESDKHGLTHLGNEMFSRLLEETNLDMFNPFSKLRLKRKTVLLVLDGVDKLEQLKYLAGDKDWFGLGSKIIVTSRDLQVLKKVADEIYEVEALDFDEALELFYLNAFKRNSFKTSYSEISKRVVSYTKGNPLALEVLGSFLYSLHIEEWESALEKLKRVPNGDIQKVLRISYDGLDYEEKDIFLDIACFFKGKDRDFIEGILESKSIFAIRVLVNKSLITIEDRKLCMHDFIQEMGWEIVREESPKEPGKRSRLWNAEHVSHVLRNNKGTAAIEGISLDMSKIEEELHLRPRVFKEMYNLRLLKIYQPENISLNKCKLYIHQGLNYLPNSLRYLDWHYYPVKSLPLNFKPQTLVELHLPNSNLMQLWDGVQNFENLKYVNLSYSTNLTRLSDLSLAPKLECINLEECTSLLHVPSLNIQANLDDFAYSCLLWSLSLPIHKFNYSPGTVNLSGCHNLKILPQIFGNITVLRLSFTAVEELPSWIVSQQNLVYLDLSGCTSLKILPKLPKSIEVMILNYTGIEEIPSSSIECLSSLRLIYLKHCSMLESLPTNFWTLKTLESVNLEGCSKLRNLHKFSNCMEPFQTHNNLAGTSILESPSSIENIIGFHGCSNLEKFSMSLGLSSLEILDLSYCNIIEIPDWFGSLSKLVELRLRGNNFDRIPSTIGQLYKLEKLDISDCKNLRSLPELPFLKSLCATECLSLEIVSTSRSTITLGRWLETNFVHFREFWFLNCLKLDDNARNNIFTEFQYKVFCTATIPLPEFKSKRQIARVAACYPGNKIPKWFSYQSKGSSTTIKLPLNQPNTKTFLGFVVSIVMASDNWNYISCELHYKMSDRPKIRADVFSRDLLLQKVDSQREEEKIKNSSEHVLMWYRYFDNSKADFETYNEVSFDFSCNYEVQQCGVRLLYLDDALEELDDSTAAEYGSWTKMMDVSIDESSVSERMDSDADYATADDDEYHSCGSETMDSDSEEQNPTITKYFDCL